LQSRSTGATEVENKQNWRVMRQGPNSRRARGRSSSASRRTNLPNRNQTFDSNGPEVRIRGNAYQVHEKYLTLARDASAAGDRVMSENYLQHAEHYYRIINAMNEAYAQAERQPYDGQQQQQPTGREGTGREGTGRESSGRESGGRESGGRESGGREGKGRDQAHKDNGRGDGDSRDGQDRELEFGEDPRGIEDSEPMSLDRAGGEGDLGSAASGESEGESGGEPAKPTRQRRRPPRPRRPSSGNGSAEATESSGEGGGD
jgi:hypothetical protein